jgi:hypothetical protein
MDDNKKKQTSTSLFHLSTPILSHREFPEASDETPLQLCCRWGWADTVGCPTVKARGRERIQAGETAARCLTSKVAEHSHLLISLTYGKFHIIILISKFDITFKYSPPPLQTTLLLVTAYIYILLDKYGSISFFQKYI